MKKFNLIILSVISLALFSCKNEPELGEVTLDTTQKEVVFGQVFTIKPIFSETGIVKNKTYHWSSNADSIASVAPSLIGGYGEVTPHRVGEAVISYKSSDGEIERSAKITVTPRSNILNGMMYYAKGKNKNDVRNNISGSFFPVEEESNDNFLVFKNSSENSSIFKLIYEFDNGNSLNSLYVVLKNNVSLDTKDEVIHYIEERFKRTNKVQDGILYFLNTGFIASSVPPIGTMMGIFADKTINGTEYALGVKVIDQTLVP